MRVRIRQEPSSTAGPGLRIELLGSYDESSYMDAIRRIDLRLKQEAVSRITVDTHGLEFDDGDDQQVSHIVGILYIAMMATDRFDLIDDHPRRDRLWRLAATAK